MRLRVGVEQAVIAGAVDRIVERSKASGGRILQGRVKLSWLRQGALQGNFAAEGEDEKLIFRADHLL